MVRTILLVLIEHSEVGNYCTVKKIKSRDTIGIHCELLDGETIEFFNSNLISIKSIVWNEEEWNDLVDITERGMVDIHKSFRITNEDFFKIKFADL